MPPVVPFIPLIAAGVGAAGGVGAALISRKKSAATQQQSSGPLAPSSPAIEDPKNKQGILPLTSSPLGDTTNPNLKRGRLLGN